MTLEEVNLGVKYIDVKGKKYAMVNERIKAFRKLYPSGTIRTEIISNDGETVVMKAEALVGTIVLGTGHAFETRQSSYINKTSYIENCETSAVGRALGMVGIGIDDSMASADEIANAIIHQNDIKTQEVGAQTIPMDKTLALMQKCMTEHISVEKLNALYKVDKLADLNEKQHRNILDNWDKVVEKCGRSDGSTQ